MLHLSFNLKLVFLIILIFNQISMGQDNQIRLNAEKLQTEADELYKKNTAESRIEAKKKYLENLSVWESLNATDKQGETLNKLAEISYLTDDIKKGLEYSQKSLSLFQKLGNRIMEAETLNNIGAFLDTLGQTKESFPFLLKSVEILRELGDKQREAKALNTIGISYSNIGEMQKGIDFLQRSLLLRRETKDRAGEGRTLINLGSIYDDTGAKRQATEFYEEGLQIAEEEKDLRTQSVALNNLGMTWNHLGEYQKSLDYHQKALVLRRQGNDKRGEAITLNNISAVYQSLGEFQESMELMEEALKIFQASGLRRNEARSLSSIGAMYSERGDEAKAVEFHLKALEIHRSLGNKEGQSSVLRNIGIIYGGQNKIQEALKFLSESLELAEEINETKSIAKSMAFLGRTYRQANDEEKATEYFTKALKIQRNEELKQDLVETLYHYAQFEADFGRKDSAIEKMKELMLILEDLRNTITSQAIRSSYLAQNQKYYDFYIRLLLDSHKLNPNKGFNALALKISESARARSLLDSLGELKNDIRGQIPPELLEEERILRQTINAKETQRLDAVAQKLTAKAAEFEKELQESIRQYQILQTKIYQSNPQFASLNNPEPLSLEEIQKQVLDDETVLLEYFLGERRSFVFFVTKTNLEIFELPSRELIETQIRQTLENIKARTQTVVGEDPLQRAERLKKADLNAERNLADTSEILLAPIAGKIQNKRLAIVASGILQYLPFAALPNPSAKTEKGYLIETNEIINLPSASILPLLRQTKRKTPKNQIAILADPVFSQDDVRLKMLQNSGQNSPNNGVMREVKILLPKLRSDFSRLRFSRIEAEEILELANDNQRFVALDFAANLKAANSESLQTSRVVHFATHGVVNSQFPELSGIVLSLVDEKGNRQEGFLRLHDVYNLRLEADLVVLSACETALGKEVKGEGIVGLTRGFMFAGAPMVAASLWRVEDQATADLMKRFYQRMLLEKVPPATALRQAQISMLKEKASAQPFYWAGFTLQGDWK